MLYPDLLTESGMTLLSEGGLRLQAESTYIKGYLFMKELEDFLLSEMEIDVWPGKLPTNATLPALVYNLISNKRAKRLDSASTKVIWLCQFDIYSESPWEAEEMSEKLRLSIEGFRGKMGNADVIYTSPESGSTKFEELKDSDSEGMHRMISEYRIYVKINPVIRT